MDVLKIGSNWFPTRMVEGFTSKIWTERFSTPGEFEFKTNLIKETRNALPVDGLVSIRSSNTVMIVESHEIGRDDQGIPELTITGRTFESFIFENRNMVGDLSMEGNSHVKHNPDGTSATETPSQASKWKMKKAYDASEAAALIIWNTVVDNNPVITGVNYKRTFVGNPHDLFDNLVVTITKVNLKHQEKWWLNLGPLGANVESLLTTGNIGVRCIRPLSDSNGLMHFDADGTEHYGHGKDITELRIDIYDGVDRTDTQYVRDAVVLSDEAGHLSGMTYLFSKKDTHNIDFVDSVDELNAFNGDLVNDPKMGPLNATGIDRRVTYESTSLQQRKHEGDTEFNIAINHQAMKTLKGQRPQTIFEGQVSPDIPYVYGRDYNLGDVITIRGLYGIAAPMKVSEFVLTEDDSGESGYPTLVVDT